MYKNIKPRNIKQFIKRELLKFNINLYLKINIIHKGYMYDRMINKDKINRNLYMS